VQKWVQQIKDLNLPLSENFSVEQTLGDPLIIREWNMNGLPSDSVSIENAIFTKRGFRWPMLIDPQFQANEWIKKVEQNNNLQVVKFTDA
jgi:dynein heavy chain